MEAKSPFKFLDAYTANDTDIFVGREIEEKKLFQQLRNTTLNLLYGMSGTGKTSLAQCGLAKFYDGADWHPFYIRRGNNINESLLKALKDTLIDIEDAAILDAYKLPELVYQVFITFSRPVYLIFDQFEELFTIASNNKEERESFFKTIQELQKQNLPCKIIIIIREEFLGELYEYEKFVPNLFDFRLRIEPMTVAKLKQVTTHTLDSFDVKVSQDNLIDTITQNLLDGKISSQLAFLQVYLDRLWQEAEYDNQQVTISDATVSKVGKIEAVLERFLDNQLASIADKNDEKQKQLRLLLDRFVTEDGTKRPIAEDKLTAFEKTLVQQLESVRIIRKNEIYYELAHDTLAVIINNKRDAEQRLIKSLVQNLQTSYFFYKKENGGFLSEQSVALYDRFKNAIDDTLSHSEEKTAVFLFIENSRKENAKEKEELEKKNKRLRSLLTGVIVLGLFMLGLFIFAYNQYYKAEKARLNAQANLDKYNKARAIQLLIDAQTFLESKDTVLAKGKIREAYTLDTNSVLKNKLKWLLTSK
ncbi:MAG: ATP-binding protein [Flectobacillus sp.]|uniref:ATP-binding protein n=1 Tax=Flectobacillus sp. TaxID=50419 RepID=UPI003B99937F